MIRFSQPWKDSVNPSSNSTTKCHSTKNAINKCLRLHQKEKNKSIRRKFLTQTKQKMNEYHIIKFIFTTVRINWLIKGVIIMTLGTTQRNPQWLVVLFSNTTFVLGFNNKHQLYRSWETSGHPKTDYNSLFQSLSSSIWRQFSLINEFQWVFSL